jgi:hypothetical protein
VIEVLLVLVLVLFAVGAAVLILEVARRRRSGD